MKKVVSISEWKGKDFLNAEKAESVFRTVHPFFKPALKHYKKREAKFDDVKTMDRSSEYCPVKNLEKCIEKGDSLAENALHFFKNTLWGNEYILGQKTFDHALDCIELDICDGDISPAQSLKQANLFIKRLKAAVKWIVTRKEVVSEIPERWTIEADYEIYLRKNLVQITKTIERWLLGSSNDLKLAKLDPWAKIETLENGDVRVEYHKLEIKRDDSYDPSDDAVGWGNAYGD